MLKAIKVLKNILNIADYGRYMEEQETIKEAIKELEELNNRSCDGCKYEAEKDCKGNFITVCKRFPRLTDRYETKDNK